VVSYMRLSRMTQNRIPTNVHDCAERASACARMVNFAAIVTCLFFLCVSPALGVRYILINVDAESPDTSSSFGAALNNAGEIVGTKSFTDDARQPFLYTGGQFLLLGLPADQSAGLSINIHRDVIIETGNGTQLRSGGNSVSLGSFIPAFINDARQIAGFAQFGFYPSTPSRREANGQVTAIGWIGGYEDGADIPTMAITGINSLGSLFGYSNIDGRSGVVHAFRTVGNTPEDLQTADSETYGAAFGMNTLGIVAGNFAHWFQGNPSYAALWEKPGPPLLIPGGTGKSAVSVNDSYEVVGNGTNSEGAPAQPFLFQVGKDNSEEFRVLSDLSSQTPAPWTIDCIYAINSGGQVTGYGSINNATRAFLGTPFYRQADALHNRDPDVPKNYGNIKTAAPGIGQLSDTVASGCVLCSAASIARSLIGLHPLQQYSPTITPIEMDRRLKARDLYTKSNDLSFGTMLRAVSDLARIEKIPSPAFTVATLSAVLEDQIYGLGYRVLLQLSQTVDGVPKSEKHTVWVVGKQGDDWKVADGGWGSGNDGEIDSLNAHLAGFETGAAGSRKLRVFTPSALHIYRNIDYVVPAAAGNGLAVREPAEPMSDPTLSVTGQGPINILLSDFEGNRTGHDQATGTDLAEIPESDVSTSGPFGIIDDEANPPSETGREITELLVEHAKAGQYTFTATGNDSGTADIAIRILGPGGGFKTIRESFAVTPGASVVRQIDVTQPGRANLSVTQTVTPDQATVGNEVQFSATVTNHGPDVATSVALIDTFPENADFVSATIGPTTINTPDGLTYLPLPNIPSGDSVIVTIVVRPKAGGVIRNFVSVTSFEEDLDRIDNATSSEASVGITFEAWRNREFTVADLSDPSVSGPTSDPDRDGRPNLLEYAFNLKPKVPDVSGFPAVFVLDGVVSFSYKATAGIRDLAFTVEGSSDLVQWRDLKNESSSNPILNVDGSITTTVFAHDLASEPIGFWRLKATKLDSP